MEVILDEAEEEIVPTDNAGEYETVNPEEMILEEESVIGVVEE